MHETNEDEEATINENNMRHKATPSWQLSLQPWG
jgi:hypothetical protein